MQPCCGLQRPHQEVGSALHMTETFSPRGCAGCDLQAFARTRSPGQGPVLCPVVWLLGTTSLQDCMQLEVVGWG